MHMTKVLNNLRKSILYLQKAIHDDMYYGHDNKHLLKAMNILTYVDDVDLNRLIINDKINEMNNNLNDMDNTKKINVDELYAFITKHMTAEQALKTLLNGKIHEYEVLRFTKDNEIHPLMLIVMAANEMGWNIALKNYDDNEDEDVEGIIVGTEEYLNSVLDITDEGFVSNNACCGGHSHDTTVSNTCCGGNSCQGCDPNDTNAKTTYNDEK